MTFSNIPAAFWGINLSVFKAASTGLPLTAPTSLWTLRDDIRMYFAEALTSILYNPCYSLLVIRYQALTEVQIKNRLYPFSRSIQNA
jgi:hypothetical protein